MRPKYGIIGCGGISRFHFGGLSKIGADIVNIADINEKAAEPYLKQYGARFSRDYNELINDPEVTVVSVLTNSRFHKDICLKAIAAGKDVICEKTMAENAADAGEIAIKALGSDSIFFTAFMKRFFPAAKKARELAASLGTIFSAQVRTYQPWGNFYDAKDEGDFKFVFGSYGGAIIKCAGSHMLDMMMYMLGRPERVYSYVDYIPGTRFDRKATALFEYSGGMTVSFEAASHPLKRIGYERNSWDEFIQINGVNGRIDLYTVMWDHPENNGALLVHYDNDKETSTEYRFAAVNPFDIEMEYFNSCLEKRDKGIPSVVDGFNVDTVIDAMVESMDKKVPIRLDWKGI
jgi:Predicted dehydrogenases and related proteins